MNKQELGEVLNVVKAMYPFFLKDTNQKLAFDLWFDGLKDCEYMDVLANLKKYSIVNKFPPTISDLIVIDSKYPGHNEAGETLDRVQQFKKDRAAPPVFDIRKHLRG